MDNFRFSLWVFDKDFILSVVIMVFSLFVISFVFTKIATSKRVYRVVNGPDPEEMRRKEYCKSLTTMMWEEIGQVRNGRPYSEMSDEEWRMMRDIRTQYLDRLKGDSDGRKQLRG